MEVIGIGVWEVCEWYALMRYSAAVCECVCVRQPLCVPSLCPGGEEGYFTGVMLKKSRVKFLQSEIVPFPMTQMMRNLLVVQVGYLTYCTTALDSQRTQH